ncbi:MAG: hypothetical protein ACI308_02475 [Muribaculaceae bacterium]
MEQIRIQANHRRPKKIFKVTKVTVKDVEIDNNPNREISIEATQLDCARKIKFKAYEELSFKKDFMGNIKQLPLINFMPIVFNEPFNNYSKVMIDTNISKREVKDTYKITDVYIGNGENNGEIYYEVKNNRTGEIKNILARKTDDVFKDALQGYYKTALIQVDKPKDSSNRYGEITTITDDGVEKYAFADNIINIIIVAFPKQFSFILKNVTTNSLKIIWDEAVYVGLDGTTAKVMHSGTKLSERYGNQPASVIIQGALLEDVACPIDNVFLISNAASDYFIQGNVNSKGWGIKPMLPESFVGKEIGEIRLMLPIQIKDVVNEYTFVFKVYYSFAHPELIND